MKIENRQWINNHGADALLQALDNSDVRVFMYYPQTKIITVPEKACEAYHCKPIYENMPQSFADDYVHENDHAIFSEMYYAIDRGEPTATAVFHSQDLNFCNHVTLTTVSWDESGKPTEVFGIIEDMSDAYKSDTLVQNLQRILSRNIHSDDSVQEAIALIADVISDSYRTIYHIWLDDLTYVSFQDERNNRAESLGDRVPVNPVRTDMFVENFVEPEYKAGVREFFSFDTLTERLENVNHIEYMYRRTKFGWTKAQFTVAKRDETDRPTNVIFTVVDINEEVEQEEKKKRTAFELTHDPLTKTYNRKAFDDMEQSRRGVRDNIGLAIIDIDNFKIVNDTFGHDMGDQVLIETAKQLSSYLRKNDKIFRIGGDEFAVLLQDCNESGWRTLCEKQHRVHEALDQILEDMSVTLSIGIAFSENGYSDELFQQADDMLYETKRRGRAGSSMIDTSSNNKQYWRDDKLSYKARNVLAFNNTGLYRIEYPLDEDIPPRLFCGEMTRELFDFGKDATTEECYRIWSENIDPSYREILTETRASLLQGGQAECTYLWNHPKLGKIFIRTGGSGEVVDGVQILHGYHHSMEGTRIMERKDESQLLVDSMSAIYFCSYYIDIDNDCFYTMKNAPGETHLEIQDSRATDAMNQFVTKLVEPEDQEAMATFVDLKTIRDRLSNEVHLDYEYQSCTEKGWCRATFFPVKRNEEGKLTHVLFMVTSLDEHRAEMAKRGLESRKSVKALYNNVPCGLMMYEWDGKRLKTLHISAYYEKEYGYTLNSGEDGSRGPDFKRVHPDDLVEFQRAIMKALTETHEIHYEYRVWNRTETAYRWTRVDATSKEQEDGTSLVYALYTDVTNQKHLENDLEKSHKSMTAALGASNLLSYEYDPVTHTGVCFTEENYFALPKVINNYPDSLTDFDLFHPDDAHIFIETAHKMDSDAMNARCDVRIKSNGRYGWYSCAFNSYYDLRKARKVAILTVVDISDRKSMMEDYDKRLEAALGVVENSLVVGQCNLTDNTVDFFKASDKMKLLVDGVKTFDERFGRNVSYIVGDKNKQRFAAMFNRKALLELAEHGQMHISMEYLLRVPDYHTVWIETGVNMVKNPLTGTITAISYSRNIQNARMSALILKNTLNADYIKNVIVLTDTGEFYTVDEVSHMDNCNADFWEHILKALQPLSDESSEHLAKMLSREAVLSHLADNDEYTYSFNSSYYSEGSRLQIRFSNLLKDQNLVLVSIRNITDTVLIDKYRHDSEHDSLTDLYNRTTVFRKCRELIDEHPDDNIVMVHFDIKHFKLYNSFFGEEAGDKLLCDIAGIFKWIEADYEYITYGRIDADVFCSCFPYNEKTYRRHLTKVIDILKNYRDDFLVEPAVGLYFVTDRSMPTDAMFTRATLAAKSLQAGTPLATVVYDEKLERNLNLEQQVLNEMQTAIDEEQFEVYLQPKYSLKTGKTIGAEALVRWNHPLKGMIPPGVFIPIFERYGFITTLDHYVWEQSCALLHKWKAEGRTLKPVSVNVSRLSMYSKSTVDYLKGLVEKFSINPELLELELTESAYIDDADEMKKQMLALRDAGFKIDLDDFGSGYSSLNALRELPVDVLKMDLKFLTMEKDDVRGSHIISSIINMAKLLDLVVVAEGVETQEQADFLRRAGCEYAQGYLYARPMPSADYEKIIDKDELMNS